LLYTYGDENITEIVEIISEKVESQGKINLTRYDLF